MFQVISKHFGLNPATKAQHCEIQYQIRVADVLPVHCHCLGRQKQGDSVARLKRMTLITGFSMVSINYKVSPYSTMKNMNAENKVRTL